MCKIAVMKSKSGLRSAPAAYGSECPGRSSKFLEQTLTVFT
jgi:hypothetical protein